jgi:hypothetical protein
VVREVVREDLVEQDVVMDDCSHPSDSSCFFSVLLFPTLFAFFTDAIGAPIITLLPKWCNDVASPRESNDFRLPCSLVVVFCRTHLNDVLCVSSMISWALVGLTLHQFSFCT